MAHRSLPRTVRLVAPNGSPIIGTADTIPGTALADTYDVEPDGSLTPNYVGETDVYWDGQTTNTDANGETLYVAEDGNEWPESQLRRVPADEDESADDEDDDEEAP